MFFQQQQFSCTKAENQVQLRSILGRWAGDLEPHIRAHQGPSEPIRTTSFVSNVISRRTFLTFSTDFIVPRRPHAGH